MPRLRKGSTIGNYLIEEQIGRGGMGIVYAATHVGLDRRVALKVIADDLAEDEGFRERFRREPRLAASIEHENVVPVFDAGEASGHLYVAMRLIEGDDLGTILKSEGKLDPERASAIIAQVGEALDAAHAHGLVHRDVKPANVLIERRNGHEHAYLTDFGITKGGGGSVGLTRTGDWVGTADYVAPEQIEGERIDQRTDVYALGAVLYHELSGEAPFAKESEVAKIYAHLSKPVPPITEKRKDVSAELEATIRRAMAKKPKDRYETAGEFGNEALAAARGDGKLSRATQKLVGLDQAVEPAPEPAGETVIAGSAKAAEKTAAPKPRRMFRRPQRPAPEPAVTAPPKPAPVKPTKLKEREAAAAAGVAVANEMKLGKPEEKKKPPAAAGPARGKPSRNVLVALGAAGLLLLAVAGFAIGSSGGGKSSTNDSASASSSAGGAASNAPAGDPAYATAVNAAIGRVNAASRVKLKAAASASTSSAQAGPLGDLASSYRRAAGSLAKQAHGPQLKAANAGIIAALGGIGTAYQRMSSAASSGDQGGYNAGKSAVRTAERRLDRSISRLGTLGYQTSK
jgi:hypothetical protein